MIKKLFALPILFSIAYATPNIFQQELAADKAQHQSFWRAYAKSYAIDPAIQSSLQRLVNELTTLMGVEDVTVRVAEANSLNTFVTKELDCTNTDNTYSIELFDRCKSITIGEDFINEGSVDKLAYAIAHELAHVKNNDFTKRFIVSYAYLLTAVAMLNLSSAYYERASWSRHFGTQLLNLSFACILAGSLTAIGAALLSSAAQQEKDADHLAETYLAQFNQYQQKPTAPHYYNTVSALS